jgi:hypothetical protein
MNVNAASAFSDTSYLNPLKIGGFGGDPANAFGPEFFGAPFLSSQNNNLNLSNNNNNNTPHSIAQDRSAGVGFLGVELGGVGNAFRVGMPFQGPPAKRRSSSISSGSLSPIGKQKNIALGGSSSSSGAPIQPISSFSHLFQPNLGGVCGDGDGNPSDPVATDSNINNHSNNNNSTSKQGKKDKKKRAKTFPEKLIQAMIENSDEEAVAWLPDGKSFVIVNPDVFCDDVLNKVFKESKYASFVRKLHRWGFVRLTSGTGTDCFHHPLFQRHRPDLAAKVACNPRGDKDNKPERPTVTANERAGQRPPSLAGVEKFIRAKVVAAAGGASSNNDVGGGDGSLNSDDDDDEDDDDDDVEPELSGSHATGPLEI